MVTLLLLFKSKQERPGDMAQPLEVYRHGKGLGFGPQYSCDSGFQLNPL